MALQTFKVGDLIVAKYDADRGIHCVGVVTDMQAPAFTSSLG